MKEVVLKNGAVAVVDDQDFDRVSAHRWYPCHSGRHIYAYAKIWDASQKKRRSIFMHRLITGAPKDRVVDHINQNSLDNRRENLRLCSQGQNLGNSKKWVRPNSSSPYRGVSWSRASNKWLARIKHSGEIHHLGLHFDEAAAARAYDRAARRLYGEFANLNFPAVAEGGAGLQT